MSSGSAIVIVTHNSSECVEACLRSVRDLAGWSVVLVDNASTDATVEIARRTAPNARILVNRRNMGFAAAVNQGIESTNAETIVLLNPDTIATPGSLDALNRQLRVTEVGAAGGRLTKPDGSTEIGFTVRRFPTLGSALAEVLLLNRLWPNNSLNRHYRCLDLDYSRTQEVDQPAGACLGFKRSVWEQIDGFDEGFFPVWFEDVDFCLRIRNRDWKILYCADASFLHAGGHSVSQLCFRDRQSHWYRNLLRYFSIHHRAWEVLALRVGVAAGLLVRALLSSLGARPAGSSRAEIAQAYWQVVWRQAIQGEFELPQASVESLTRHPPDSLFP